MEPAVQKMIDNLTEKTGKTLQDWLGLLAQKAPAKHGLGLKWLKSEFGIGHGYANLLMRLYRDRQDSAPAMDLLTAQYTGKESLRPIYDRLHAALAALGEDITVTPKKTSVSFIRKRQFALIKPATKTRIDLGLKLPDKPTEGRLGDAGPFGTMCTHRVILQQVDDVDAEVLAWLQEAYELAV